LHYYHHSLRLSVRIANSSAVAGNSNSNSQQDQIDFCGDSLWSLSAIEAITTAVTVSYLCFSSLLSYLIPCWRPFSVSFLVITVVISSRIPLANVTSTQTVMAAVANAK